MADSAKKKSKEKRECQATSLDYGSYGYPCHLEAGHKGQHECLDKDDCPHRYGLIPRGK